MLVILVLVMAKMKWASVFDGKRFDGELGPATILVWEIADGEILTCAYLPVGSKLGGRDGKMLVGGGSGASLGKVTMATAKKKALAMTKEALDELGLLPKPKTPMRDPNYGAPWA